MLLIVKIVKYVGVCLCRRSYLIWSPVIFRGHTAWNQSYLLLISEMLYSRKKGRLKKTREKKRRDCKTKERKRERERRK